MAERKRRKPRPSGRSGGEGKRRRATAEARELWGRLLETPALWLFLVLAVGTWLLSPWGGLSVPRVEAGAIADRDFIAPEDLLLPDEETTRRRQERAREEMPPVYDYDPGLEAEEQIGALFAAGRRLLQEQARAEELGEPQGRVPAAAAAAGEADPRVQTLLAATGLRITPEGLELLLAKGFTPELEDRLRSIAGRVVRRGVVANKELLLESRDQGVTLRDVQSGAERLSYDLYGYLGYPGEMRDLVEAEMRGAPGVSIGERRLLVDLLVANLPPNLNLNVSETLARREAAAESIPTSYTQVKKGEVIVRTGDRIGPEAALKIASYHREGRPLRSMILPPLGTFLLLALSALVVWLALAGEKVADHSRRRLFGEALLLLLLSVVGARLAFLVAEALASSFDAPPFNSLRSHLYAAPFAALALVTALLLGRQSAVVLSSIFALLVSRLAPEGDALWVLIYALAGSLAAIFALEQYQVKQRLVMTRVGLVVSGINVVTVLMLQALTGGDDGGAAQLGFDLVCAVASGLLVAAVAGFMVPILETVLGITTDFKLVELANTNLPLLRRLAFEAPGSFQHSLMVANLSKQACEAIGADASLAYTGGLYHDVGKIERSEYFIENQRPGHNLHDGLAPSMSALILISHIKDGVELARRHHLPQPLVDAIEQHHGTRLIKYFYNRALEQCDPSTEAVREEKYRYPGPKPQTKEMGVLMLADGVEAASRTLVEPTSTKIRTLIRTIIDDCLRDGQLDRTDLTLSDLRAISETFLRVLTNIFHQRVDYPGFDFNEAAAGTPAEASARA